MVHIPENEPTRHVWRALLGIARQRPEGWTLIGAQMVALHGFEQGEEPPRLSADADIIVNARIASQTVKDFARFLENEGFELEGINQDGIGHRFRRDDVAIDLLAPDGLKQTGEAVTTIPPARTVQVPGGTQALRRTHLVEVIVDKTSAHLPRPNLLGAILIKARAVDVDDVPQAQLRDLAFLLSLANDPLGMAASLSSSERKWLRRREELRESDAAPWRHLTEDQAEAGRAAYQILARL